MSYEDIINLPHHVSASHPRMSPQDRAAQFAPFAALTGHDQAIRDMEEKTRGEVEAEIRFSNEEDWWYNYMKEQEEQHE
jgi:hypothetical protein